MKKIMRFLFGTLAWSGIVLGFWCLACLRSGSVPFFLYLPICIYLLIAGITSMFVFGKMVDGK